jgi:hypothetical protein
MSPSVEPLNAAEPCRRKKFPPSEFNEATLQFALRVEIPPKFEAKFVNKQINGQ